MELSLKSGAWYHDQAFSVSFPDSWDVRVYWPDTPAPLTESEIAGSFLSPIGQPPLHEMARGKRRPLVIIDDLARPTPAYRVLPHILDQFMMAGIAPEDVRILVASGTHGAPKEEGLRRKIGRSAYESCRVVVHDDSRDLTYAGRTSRGTPVYVNREVLESDFLLGISGIYPHHLAGFGGGSKLALGILGRKSIACLHFFRTGSTHGGSVENEFRKDLEEIARIIRLNTMCTLHINKDMDVVHILFGDHFRYFPKACELSAKWYRAPVPDNADAVIVNAYPFDVHLSAARKVGRPFKFASPRAIRVTIATNTEGIGHHGLNPVIERKYNQYRNQVTKLSLMGIGDITTAVLGKLRRILNKQHDSNNGGPTDVKNRTWIYNPLGLMNKLPDVGNTATTDNWGAIINLILADRNPEKQIKVCLYPCGGLHTLEATTALRGYLTPGIPEKKNGIGTG